MKWIYQEYQKIYYNLDKILLLFAFIFAVLDFAWIPLNSWLSEQLLARTGYLYLSYNNVGALFLQHTWVALAMLGLLMVNLLVAYLQIGLLFLGVHQLLSPAPRSLQEFIHALALDCQQMVRRIRAGKVLFLFLYATILFPFLRRLLGIYFLNKIVIPQFIVDYLKTKYLLGGFFACVAAGLFYLALRFIFVLPLLYTEDIQVRRAMKFSWQKTRGKQQIFLFRRLCLLVFQVGVLAGLVIVGTVGSQLLADRGIEEISLLFAVLNYVLIRFAYYGLIAFFVVKSISILTGKTMPVYERASLRHRLRLIIVVLAAVVFAVQAAVYFILAYTVLPLTISHRGVTNQNGVQNTVASMEKTAQLKPDYIEMDIQETKDGQFVLMHDVDLFDLTGIQGTTHDFTLSELTAMTVFENGYEAKIPSFDTYLERADELGQKLLIEIKTSQRDSKEMMQHFLTRYAKRIKEKGHQIHSLDYTVIQAIKQADSDIIAYFILPYNSIFPRTSANGYTMEYSSLDYGFMDKVWAHGKKVYAWTANTADAMNRLIVMEVDGIITDDLATLKAEITDAASDKDYTELLLRYIDNLVQFHS